MGDSELPSFVIRSTISFDKDSSLKMTDKTKEPTSSNHFGLRSEPKNGIENRREIVRKEASIRRRLPSSLTFQTRSTNPRQRQRVCEKCTFECYVRVLHEERTNETNEHVTHK